MAERNVIIYEAEGADPAVDRIVTAHGDSQTTVVATDSSAIVAAAVAAADEGADQIELCGGMGPLWQAKVLDAVGDRVPVRAVMYGFESLTGAADYKARFGHEPLHAVFVYIQPGSDPAVDRTAIDDENGRTTLVAVPDAAAAPAVARQLVEEGAHLFELYGGFQPGDAARVIDAIDGRAPVGLPATAPLPDATARHPAALGSAGCGTSWSTWRPAAGRRRGCATGWRRSRSARSASATT